MARPPLGVRPDLAGLTPYVSPQMPARYRLNTNESPYPPPPEVVAEVFDALRASELNRYPDKDANRLLSALSRHLDWPEQGIWAANGSNEVFMHLLLAFGGPDRTALLFQPTYSLHGLIPRMTGTRVIEAPRGEDFEVDLGAAVALIQEHQPEIVILCSPNNPTGNCEPLSTVERVLDEAPGIVVVDEAYIDFATGDDTVQPLLEDYDNLVMVRTFSKAWRLAGVRLGYLVSAPPLLSDMARVRLPYHLSTITQIFGEVVLRHQRATLDLVADLTKERDRISVGLQRMGVKCFPSKANFLMFQVDEPNEVWEALLERDVLVRNYAGVPGIQNCLRVTAGMPDETDAFLEAMEEAIDA